VVIKTSLVCSILAIAAIAVQCSVTRQTECLVATAKLVDRTLVILLENNSDEDICFWELGNMWGDGSFYLLLRNRDTSKIVVARFGQTVYGRSQPSTQLIRKGNAAEFRIDLDSSAWGEAASIMNDARYQIETLIVSSKINDETISSGVFLDRLIYDFPSKE